MLLVQFAILYRGGEKVQMSTRSGEFVTLRELREEVGRDAARFFYVMRKCEQHLDFDLDLAKSQSNDNPVYYVQYAHARIASVLRQAAEKGLHVEPSPAARESAALDASRTSWRCSSRLSRYPEVVEAAALSTSRTSSPTTCASWPTISTPTTTPTSSWSRTRPCATRG